MATNGKYVCGREEGPAGRGIVAEGLVAEILPKGMFLVDIPGGFRALAHISGSESMRLTRILVGDRVRLNISPIDPCKGRIIDKL